MKIVCSTNMPLVEEAFATLGEPVVIEGRVISAEDVREAGVLAIRSTTKVNRALLDGSRVQFVGTATIGTDHLDIPYLERRGIDWCYSPGCNANSVSEYVVSALLYLSVKHGLELEQLTMGVIGVGNVGRRVVEKAQALGMKVLLHDPPRERELRDRSLPPIAPESGLPFVSLDTLLAAGNVVTVHVPLTSEGPDRTRHLADAAFFNALPPGAVFLNCARGPVVDTDALIAALDCGRLAHAVIDTWEGEPGYRMELLERAVLATPHIAGHSFEGKVAGTEMVYQAACRHFNEPVSWRADEHLPPALVPAIELAGTGSLYHDLWDAVRRIYDITRDDLAFRDGPLREAERRLHFDRLRKQYPMRREFRYTTVTGRPAAAAAVTVLRKLGFAGGASG